MSNNIHIEFEKWFEDNQDKFACEIGSDHYFDLKAVWQSAINCHQSKFEQAEAVEYQIKILGERWTHCAKHIYDPNNPNTRALYATPPDQSAEIKRLNSQIVMVFGHSEVPIFSQGYEDHEAVEIVTAEYCTNLMNKVVALHAENRLLKSACDASVEAKNAARYLKWRELTMQQLGTEDPTALDAEIDYALENDTKNLVLNRSRATTRLLKQAADEVLSLKENTVYADENVDVMQAYNQALDRAAVAVRDLTPVEPGMDDVYAFEMEIDGIKRLEHTHGKPIPSFIDTVKIKKLFTTPQPFELGADGYSDDAIEKVVRAFWRRIFKMDANEELPTPLPVKYLAHMRTAMMWLDKERAGSLDAIDADRYRFLLSCSTEQLDEVMAKYAITNNLSYAVDSVKVGSCEAM